MRKWLIGTGAVWILAMAAAASAQAPSDRAITFSFDPDGRVNLTARNVSVSDILAEWARQCGCYIVNADRMTATLPTPVQFEHAAQSDVLESLLRQAAGYVLTPKRAGVQAISNYETIFILATSNPVAGAYVPPPAVPTGPPPPSQGSPDDELAPVVPINQPPLPTQLQQAAEPPPPSSNPFGTRTGAFEPTPSPQGTSPGTPAQRPAPGRSVPVVPVVPVPPGSGSPR